MKFTIDKKDPFIRALIAVGLPVALQNFISTALNLVDTVMIGRVGKVELAAVGLANQLFFLMVLLVFGINSGAAVYVAQFWGKKDLSNIKRTVGVALAGGLLISVPFFFMGVFMPETVLGWFLKEPEVIASGASYLRIVAWSYLFTAASFTFAVSSRAVEQAKLPTVVSAISLGTNTLLNYLLIFGKMGMPALGVEGAAIATLIARILELFLMITLLKKNDSILIMKIKEAFSFNMAFVKQIMQTAWPVIVNEGFWALGTIMYTAALARISSDAVAAFQIAVSVFRFFEVLFIGIGSACQVTIGNRIGAGESHLAMEYGRRYIRLNGALCAGVALILWVSAPAISTLFKVPAHVTAEAILMMRIFAIYAFSKTFNLLMIVGVLRGGGDTFFAMILEIACVWLIGVPLAFLGALVLKWPAYVVCALFMFEEAVKSLIGYSRYKSKRWIRNVVEAIE